MSDAAPSPPSSKLSSHGANIARNVITGVLTTVVGAAALYFLKFNKTGESTETNMLQVQATTINAWKSYVAAENSFNNNLNIYLANYSASGFEHYKEVSLSAFDQFSSELKKILDTKNLDPSFSSMLERRMKTNEEGKKKYEEYLNNYNNITQTVSDQTERNTKLNEESDRFNNEKKERDQVFASDVDELCKTLNAKYTIYNFTKNDLVIYQQTNTNTTNTNNTNTTNTNSGTDASNNSVDWRSLVGKWVDGNNVLYQQEDGKMYYYFGTTDSTYGSWQIYNNQLFHYYNQYYGAGNRWTYNIQNLTQNSFSAVLVDSPYTQYNFVRSNN